MKLTKEIAIEWVTKIKAIADRDNHNEDCHEEEDKLYWRFIDSVANGDYAQNEATEIANILKQTKLFGIVRFYG